MNEIFKNKKAKLKNALIIIRFQKIEIYLLLNREKLFYYSF